MMDSRLVLATRLVAEAMQRSSPDTLLDWLEGEPARIATQAGGGRGDRAEPVALHPSWIIDPVTRLPADARAPLLSMLDPEIARFAALAVQQAVGEEVMTRTGVMAGGESARSLLASQLGVLPASPGWLGGDSDPASLARRMKQMEDDDLVDRVFDQWPEQAREGCGLILDTLGDEKNSTAKRFTALAACLVAYTEQARRVALGLPRPLGLAFLATRNLFWRTLDSRSALDLAHALEKGT